MVVTTRVFEDVEEAAAAVRTPQKHKRTPSMGEFLRGRRNKENDASRTQQQVRSPSRGATEKPLGERPVNSPSQLCRVPIKDEEWAVRPVMPKKAKTGISLKSLVNGTEAQDGGPKKSRSSTNLAGLLKKKSNKNLQEAAATGQEARQSSSPTKVDNDTRAPLWVEYASRLPETRQVPESHNVFNVQPKWNGLHPPPKSAASNREMSAQGNKRLNAPPADGTTSGFSRVQGVADERPWLQGDFRNRTNGKEEVIPATQNSSMPNQERQHRPRSSCFQDCCSSPAKDRQLSKVQAAIGTLDPKSSSSNVLASGQNQELRSFTDEEIGLAFEALLDARNIAPNMRAQMRALDRGMKLKLIHNQRGGSGSSTSSTATDGSGNSADRGSNSSAGQPAKSRGRSEGRSEPEPSQSRWHHSRSRSRGFTLTKRDDGTSPSKKHKGEEPTSSRGKSRPKSMEISSARPSSSRSLQSTTSMTGMVSSPSKADSLAAPGDFIHYLREVVKPELVDLGKIHKLRILLRNESIAWTDAFIKQGGMTEMVELLYRITRVEWREEHEDTLLHETLLCLKALCTTSLALERLADIEADLFSKLLAMLFDEEKKGPSEFATRGIIISLLFAHLSAARDEGDNEKLIRRARRILEFLEDAGPRDDKKPIDFIQQMHVRRPYRVWGREIINVSKEVFWIFLHHANIIPTTSSATGDQQRTNRTKNDTASAFVNAHFPLPRPPQPAAPYVGGVEWEATTYLATHLDLLNGLIASLPTRDERNSLRRDLRNSGWEKVMGGTLRTCKEKFYSSVHDGLKVWVGAANDDGWPVDEVRFGLGKSTAETGGSKSPQKKIELPAKFQLDVGFGDGGRHKGEEGVFDWV